MQSHFMVFTITYFQKIFENWSQSSVSWITTKKCAALANSNLANGGSVASNLEDQV